MIVIEKMFKSEKENLYIQIEGRDGAIRFMPELSDLTGNWRERVQLRETEYGQVAVLVSDLQEIDLSQF